MNRRDFPRLSSKEGYWKEDLLPDVIRRFLRCIGIEYVTPFVCFGVLPDGANPNNTLHPIHAFGDTPVILRVEIASEVGLACCADLQTTAKNGLMAGGTSGAIPANYKKMIVDLTKHSSISQGCVLKKALFTFRHSQISRGQNLSHDYLERRRRELPQTIAITRRESGRCFDGTGYPLNIRLVAFSNLPWHLLGPFG